MKVELSIKDDTELRNLIKDMIRSCIVSIAREEIRNIVHNALLIKIQASYNDKLIESMYREVIKDEIRNMLGTKYKYQENIILEEVKKEVKKATEEVDNFLENAKKNIKSFLKSKGIDVGDLI